MTLLLLGLKLVLGSLILCCLCLCQSYSNVLGTHPMQGMGQKGNYGKVIGLLQWLVDFVDAIWESMAKVTTGL